MSSNLETKNINEIKFLNDNKEIEVSIFLVNGNRLECKIIGYDDTCLIATNNKKANTKQLIYKNAIATICQK